MRGLKDRHLQLLAIGGAIGAGYFLGTGIAIQTAGPSLLAAYVIAGCTVFLIMRALGELTVAHPELGSFGKYASRFIGQRTGFITGWSYWLAAILACVAESTGAGVLVHHRFPTVPQWVAALCVVVLIYLINICGVATFGEWESWLAIVKVATVVAVVGYGVAVITFHFGRLAPGAHLSNLWRYSGFAPNRVSGLLHALPIVIFAFGGVEVIGLASAEAEQPEVAVPRAINNVLYRILLFYVGSFATIMTLLPWTQYNAYTSPFVVVLSQAGFSAAPDAVFLITVIAIISSGNTTLFASTRMLRGLAAADQAPAGLGQLNHRRVPWRAVALSTSVLLAGVGLSYLVPGKALIYVMSAASWPLLWAWASIILSHLGYRRTLHDEPGNRNAFEMPGAPVTSWLVLVLISVVGVLLALSSDMRLTFLILAVWLTLLIVIYSLRRRLGFSAGIQALQKQENEVHS